MSRAGNDSDDQQEKVGGIFTDYVEGQSFAPLCVLLVRRKLEAHLKALDKMFLALQKTQQAYLFNRANFNSIRTKKLRTIVMSYKMWKHLMHFS